MSSRSRDTTNPRSGGNLVDMPKPASLSRRRIRLPVRVRFTSREHLDELVAFLRREADASVEQVSEDELEVSLLGSYNHDAMRMELELRLRAWEAGRGGRKPHAEIVG